MTTPHHALLAASRLRQTYVGETGYGLAYGSHPAGTASPRSDLDMVFLTPRRLSSDTVTQLANAVQRLHHQHGLDLDTEVDYTGKVHASFAEVDTAVSLRCFDLDDDGRVTVAPVVVTAQFLNSPAFSQRLLLNALTTPHTFLGGALGAYEQHCRRAERALALLGLSVLDDSETATLDAIVAAVTHGPGGARGKDYLGYGPTLDLYSRLRRGLAQLAHCGVVRGFDGTRFVLDPPACRAEVLRLGLATADRREPGTMLVDQEG